MGLIALIPVIGEIVDKLIPDPNQRMQMQIQLSQIADQESARESNERIAQINVNNTEAANPNMLVAGWRPAVGWICAAGTGINFVILPLADWIATVGFGYTGTLPGADMANLMTLLAGMLGFGYLRSKEKSEGVEDTVIHTQKSADKVNAAPKKKILGIDWPF